MHEIKLRAETRMDTAKGGAGRLRRQGLVPAVLYGRQSGNIPLAIKAKELERVIAVAGTSALVRLEVCGDGGSTEYITLVREVQRHPLYREPVHVDFYQVSMERRLQLTVPVELVGEAIGCKDGGVLQHGVREIHLECLPADIPEVIRVDVSGLDTGDRLTVGDIELPRGVRAVSDPVTMVAAVVQPGVAVEPAMVPAADAAEPVESKQVEGKTGTQK